MLRVVGAELVWTGSKVVPGGEVVCDEGRVRPSGSGVPPAVSEVLDASGCVVTPGLVNAHHHLLQSAFRTLPGTRRVRMAEWLAVMAAAYRRIGVDEELAGAAAAVGAAEGLLCGVTTVADHHLTWPADTDRLALARASIHGARSVGTRLVFVCGTAGDDAEIAAAGADAVAAWAAAAGDELVSVAVGPAGVHSDSPETFRLLGEVAARRGLRRRTQAGEQVDVERAAARYGRHPLDLLEDWGWLAPDVTVAHLCGITVDHVRRLATTGATATHAPGCDLPGGWGVAPAGALIDAGVAVGLGTSGGGSNDAGHLLADARLALQVSPLTGRALSAAEVLDMATAGGAAGLGRADLGRLECGSAADLCCWDVSGVADAGVADPLAGLLWAAPGRRPRHVVVGGRVVVRDGRLVTGDEQAIAGALRSLLAGRAWRQPCGSRSAMDI